MSREHIEVDIHWYVPVNGLFSAWDYKECVYAYHVTAYNALVPYVGKAVYCTARQRVVEHESDGVNKRVYEAFPSHTIYARVGKLTRRDGKPVTASFIDDIESVLIYRLQPTANISKKKSISVGYPITIYSKGAWPFIQNPIWHDGRVVTETAPAGFLSALAGLTPAPNPFTSILGLSSLASGRPLSILGSLRPVQPPTSPTLSDLLRTSEALKNPGVFSLMRMISQEKPK